jgi:hypothetical protein
MNQQFIIDIFKLVIIVTELFDVKKLSYKIEVVLTINSLITDIIIW